VLLRGGHLSATDREDAKGNPFCCLTHEGGMCHQHARGILPQLAEPHWYRLAKTGDANRSDEAPTLVLARQKYERQQRVNRRLLRATTGAFTGRNRGGFVRGATAPNARPFVR
jgi:hypothetical protein